RLGRQDVGSRPHPGSQRSTSPRGPFSQRMGLPSASIRMLLERPTAGPGRNAFRAGSRALPKAGHSISPPLRTASRYTPEERAIPCETCDVQEIRWPTHRAVLLQLERSRAAR
ncbi:unnamed protein product, partial [Ixodes hexagonus]